MSTFVQIKIQIFLNTWASQGHAVMQNSERIFWNGLLSRNVCHSPQILGEMMLFDAFGLKMWHYGVGILLTFYFSLCQMPYLGPRGRGWGFNWMVQYLLDLYKIACDEWWKAKSFTNQEAHRKLDPSRTWFSFNYKNNNNLFIPRFSCTIYIALLPSIEHCFCLARLPVLHLYMLESAQYTIV